MRRFITAVWLVAAAATSCSPVQNHTTVEPGPGQWTGSISDVVLRVSRTDDLPNAFGRADLFGRTRDRGFTEIRYMGLDGQNRVVFYRRDVDIVTNESTMSRSPGFSSWSAQAHAQQTGSVGSAGGSAGGVAMTPALATIEPLPPDTTRVVLDLSQGSKITVGQHGLEVIKANGANLSYRSF